jgi:hypothetical protein
MKSVYYVQRLNAPAQPTPFDFGGGYLNGGINKEAMAIISKVFSFDYMGSAEFEWGAVPTALQTLNAADKLATFTISTRVDGEDKMIYGICLPHVVDDTIAWVVAAAKGNTGNLKENLGLGEALRGNEYARTKGWLKIEEDKRCDEPFMFFIDKDMFTNTCTLLGTE